VGYICGAVGLTITIASFVKSAKDMRSGAISFEKFCVKNGLIICYSSFGGLIGRIFLRGPHGIGIGYGFGVLLAYREMIKNLLK
jgi:hypothetical protein